MSEPTEEERDPFIAEENAAADRQRARALRWETEDRHRTRWRRRGRAAVPYVSAVLGLAALSLGVQQFNQQSSLTRELFTAEFEQNREIFEEEVVDRNAIRMVRAWQVLRSATTAAGNVGQITALQTLHRGGENLRKLGLGCPKAKEPETIEPGSCMYLAGVDLSAYETEGIRRAADLRGADFSGADLSGANLKDADLRGANLRGADLTDANLTDADLTRADLRGAGLKDADLTHANLTEANLKDADLTDANLTDADFVYADLSDSNLADANFRGADLSAATFDGAKNVPDLSVACTNKVYLPIGLTPEILDKIGKPCPDDGQ